MAKKIDPMDEEEPRLSSEEFLSTIPRLVLPPFRPPTEQDLEIRRDISEKMDQLRQRSGPIEGSVADLIRADRSSR